MALSRAFDGLRNPGKTTRRVPPARRSRATMLGVLERLEERRVLAAATTSTWLGAGVGVDDFLGNSKNWDVFPTKDTDTIIFPNQVGTHVLRNNLFINGASPNALHLKTLHLGGGYTIKPDGGAQFIVQNFEIDNGNDGTANFLNDLQVPITLATTTGGTHAINGPGNVQFSAPIGEESAGQRLDLKDSVWVVMSSSGNQYTGKTTLTGQNQLVLKCSGVALQGDVATADFDVQNIEPTIDNPNPFPPMINVAAENQFSPNSVLTVGVAGRVLTSGFSLDVGSLILKNGTVDTTSPSKTGTITLHGDLSASSVAYQTTYYPNSSFDRSSSITGNLSLGDASRTFTLTPKSLPENGGPKSTVPSLVMNGSISQTGNAPVGLTLTGTGGLLMQGTDPNTYTGTTTLQTTMPLQLKQGGAAGKVAIPGGLVGSFAKIDLLAPNQFRSDKPVQLTVGQIALNGNNQAVGDLTLKSAQVGLSAGLDGKPSPTLGNLTVNGKIVGENLVGHGYSFIGGTFKYSDSQFRTGTVILGPGSHEINVSGPNTPFDTKKSSDLVIYVPLTQSTGGAASVRKSGTGALEYNLATRKNTYTGLTTVADGTLVLNSSTPSSALSGDLMLDATGGTSPALFTYGNQLLPATTNLTFKGSGATLLLNGRAQTVASLTFQSSTASSSVFPYPVGSLIVSGGITATGFSTFIGPLFLTPDTKPHVVNTPSATDYLQVNGAIAISVGGPTTASLTKTGPGVLIFAGLTSNTYTGSTQVDGGTLVLTKLAAPGKPAVLSVPGALTINPGAAVLFGTGDQINPAARVTISGGVYEQNGQKQTLRGGLALANGGILRTSGGLLTLTGPVNVTAGSAAISGKVAINDPNLRITVDPAASRLKITADLSKSTALAGTAGLSKFGAGTLVLTGTNTYKGATTLAAGTLNVVGIQGDSPVNVSGGILGGTGTIGKLTVTAGTVSPGLGNPGSDPAGVPSVLTVNGDASFAVGTTLAIVIDGAATGGTIGRGVTTLLVTGKLTLASAIDGTRPTLSGRLASSTLPSPDALYRIVVAGNIAPGSRFDGIQSPYGMVVLPVPGSRPRIFIAQTLPTTDGKVGVDLSFNS